MAVMSFDTSYAVRSVGLPAGESVAALGQGTWGMAEDPRHRKDEISALRLGLTSTWISRSNSGAWSCTRVTEPALGELEACVFPSDGVKP